MKYALFVYDRYYPNGGWEDFYSLFESVEGAVDFIKKEKMGDYCWHFHIVDMEEKRVLCKGGGDADKSFYVEQL